jgi:hypothetical protein
MGDHHYNKRMVRNGKWYFGFFWMLCLTACAAPPVTQTAAPLSTPEPVAALLTAVPTPQPSATARFVPKQNDLLFVEFFAVT